MTHASDEFDDLYRRHAPAAFRRARRLLGTEADAHQVVHDVFLALFERPQQYTGQGRMSTFLYSAITHACLNRMRNQRARREPAIDQHGPASWNLAAQDQVGLRALLWRMPEPLVKVAVYQYMDELTHDEISRLLDCSRQHVGDLLERLSAWARTRPEACPSDLILDSWTAAELDAKVAAQVEQHLSHCTRCRAQRTAFEQERAAFLATAPTFEAQRKLLAAAAPPTRVRSARGIWAGSAALALVLCAVGLLAVRPWENAATTHRKSTPHLSFFIQRAEHVTRGVSGVSVQAGDVLRFTYSSERDVYLALLNMDAQAASVYYPSSTMAALRVHAGSEVPLAFSVQLDAVAGVERVLGVFCRAPFDIAPLLAALKASGKLPEEQDCHVEEIRLRKQPAQ